MISSAYFADILSVSKHTLLSKIKNGEVNQEVDGTFDLSKNHHIPFIRDLINSNYEREMEVTPIGNYSSIEVFCGAGGMALGLEKAGFHNLLALDFDKDACNTLRTNRPEWNVENQNISTFSFSKYKGKVNLLAGGCPCQPFSYSGLELGVNDIRGTLFEQFARALREVEPDMFLFENVVGLKTNDKGKTIETVIKTFRESGYHVYDYFVLSSIFHMVPQKRERLFIVGIRNDLDRNVSFSPPSPSSKMYTVRDALFKGDLYNVDVPLSSGVSYTDEKKKIMSMIPQGGYWKDLPVNLQKSYLGGAFGSDGGMTGFARRLSLDEPSLTLTTCPSQKKTERCHPIETRPLTIREYARIQTFPDNFIFSGGIASQYKQIGNAVPVNLAYRLGNSIVSTLNRIKDKK